MTNSTLSRPVLSLAGIYFLLFASLGAEVSFLPQALANNGLSARQVGLVLSVGLFTQMLGAPLAGGIADRYGPRIVLALAAISASSSLLLLSAITGAVASAMLVYVLFALATAPLNPLVDAIAVPLCRDVDFPYGRVRAGGSVGFLVGILLSSSLASWFGVKSPILTAAILFAVLAIALLTLPKATRHPVSRRAEGAIRTLLGIRPYRRILIVAAMTIGSHAMSDAFAVIYWRANNISMGTIGIILALATVAELIAFVTFGPVLVETFGAARSAALGAVFGALGWALLAASSNVWLMLITQLLHGFMFSLVHLACMQVMQNVAPAKVFAMAQSLYGICINAIASAIVTFAGGALYDLLHGYVFLLAMALCVFAFPLTLKLDADDRVEAGGASGRARS